MGMKKMNSNKEVLLVYVFIVVRKDTKSKLVTKGKKKKRRMKKEKNSRERGQPGFMFAHEGNEMNEREIKKKV